MARQTLPKTQAPDAYPDALTVVTMTAANTTDKEQFVHTGDEILIAHNSGASAHTITITSTADPQGRTKDITAQSLAAGAIACLGRLGDKGWTTLVSGQRMVYLEANHAEITFGVIAL